MDKQIVLDGIVIREKEKARREVVSSDSFLEIMNKTVSPTSISSITIQTNKEGMINGNVYVKVGGKNIRFHQNGNKLSICVLDADPQIEFNFSITE